MLSCFVFAVFVSVILWLQSRLLHTDLPLVGHCEWRVQGHHCSEPTAINLSLCSWSRSEYSRTCFTCCQEYLFKLFVHSWFTHLQFLYILKHKVICVMNDYMFTLDLMNYVMLFSLISSQWTGHEILTINQM